MSSRRDELLAKKARLAELKRQRELRQSQFSSGRQSIGGEVVNLTREALRPLLTVYIGSIAWQVCGRTEI